MHWVDNNADLIFEAYLCQGKLHPLHDHCNVWLDAPTTTHHQGQTIPKTTQMNIRIGRVPTELHFVTARRYQNNVATTSSCLIGVYVGIYAVSYLEFTSPLDGLIHWPQCNHPPPGLLPTIQTHNFRWANAPLILISLPTQLSTAILMYHCYEINASVCTLSDPPHPVAHWLMLWLIPDVPCQWTRHEANRWFQYPIQLLSTMIHQPNFECLALRLLLPDYWDSHVPAFACPDQTIHSYPPTALPTFCTGPHTMTRRLPQGNNKERLGKCG